MVSSASTPADPVDVLVFAPHPDDEVIGCGGVIQQALAAGHKVRVVFSTSGEGYPRAAAALFGKPETALTPDDFARLGAARESEAAAAARELGLGGSSLTFLRQPDAGMEKLDGAARSRTRGVFAALLRASAPLAVYVTDAADEHPDHRVTNELVVAAAAASGYSDALFTYVVHSGGDSQWPAPGRVHRTTARGGVTYPSGVSWPPPTRVPLTDLERAVKRRALKAHASQWAIDHQYLGRFVKAEEVFWRVLP